MELLKGIIMKKVTILSFVFLAFACKKEMVCECTETITQTTSSGTNTTSKPAIKTELKEIKKGEAKSWCQNTTVEIADSSTTTITENKCSLN
jgi:hypothetical protein